MILGEADNLDGVFDGLVRRATLIARAEAVTRGNHSAQLMHLSFERAQSAALVEDQTDIGDVVPTTLWQPGAYSLGIGHLRNAAGMNEAGNLYTLRP
jgi:hypothetical protein